MRAFVQLWDELTRAALRRRPTRRCAGSATASRSTRSASPRPSPRTTCSASCSRCSASRSARTPAPAPSSCPPGTRRSACRGPWDQQWSLRLQQVLAFESDLLEYDDIFEGSNVIEAKVAELVEGARAEMDRVQALGGAIAAVESGYMKQQLVSAHAARRARIESGEEKVVGVNVFETTEPSPLTADLDAAIQAADPEAEAAAIESRARLEGRARRGRGRRGAGPAGRRRQDRHQPDAGHPGRRPGRRDHGGVGRHAARGVRRVPGADRASRAPWARRSWAEAGAELAAVRERVRATGEELGGRLRLLVGKPGLDGHSNGAEQVAVRARDAGFEVDLPGHPADARGDRRGRRGRGRALRRPLDPVRLAHGAGAGGARRAARGRPGRRTRRGRRDHPRLRRPRA